MEIKVIGSFKEFAKAMVERGSAMSNEMIERKIEKHGNVFNKYEGNVGDEVENWSEPILHDELENQQTYTVHSTGFTQQEIDRAMYQTLKSLSRRSNDNKQFFITKDDEKS